MLSSSFSFSISSPLLTPKMALKKSKIFAYSKEVFAICTQLEKNRHATVIFSRIRLRSDYCTRHLEQLREGGIDGRLNKCTKTLTSSNRKWREAGNLKIRSTTTLEVTEILGPLWLHHITHWTTKMTLKVMYSLTKNTELFYAYSNGTNIGF